ncbi:hypothetical protein [Arsenophonus nasoniae]|uniref:hypothetical protein n=1 Tax=Arsenophonus nasoniae TaxID=638 RepID=UPI0038792ED5
MHFIGKKICNFLGDTSLKKKKTAVLDYIIDDLILLKKEGYTWDSVLTIINSNECNFFIPKNTFFSYLRSREINKKTINDEIRKFSKNTQLKQKEISANNQQKKEIKQEKIEYNRKNINELMGIKEFPYIKVTDDMFIAWENLNIPKVAIFNLIKHGVSLEEYKSWNIQIGSKSALIDEINTRCSEIVKNWEMNKNK